MTTRQTTTPPSTGRSAPRPDTNAWVLPIALFSIPLGMAVLGGAWDAANQSLGTPKAAPFVPVLSILLSPPATASLAWFAIANCEIDQVQAAIGGVTLFTLLVQLDFLSRIPAAPSTSQHWVFTFPLAVLGNIAIRWAAASGLSQWRMLAWATLAASTTAILAIVAGTLRDVWRWSVRRRAAT